MYAITSGDIKCSIPRIVSLDLICMLADGDPVAAEWARHFIALAVLVWLSAFDE
jgi:hypothetical protein